MRQVWPTRQLSRASKADLKISTYPPSQEAGNRTSQGVRASSTTRAHALTSVQEGVQGEVNPLMSASLVLSSALIFEVVKPQQLLISSFEFRSEEVSVVFSDGLRPFSHVEGSLPTLFVHRRDTMLRALVSTLHFKGRLSKADPGDLSEPPPPSPTQVLARRCLSRGSLVSESRMRINDAIGFGETLFRGTVKDVRERRAVSRSGKAGLEITDGGVTRKLTEPTRKRTRISLGPRSPILRGLNPFLRAGSVRVSVADGRRAEAGAARSAEQPPRSSPVTRLQIIRKHTRPRYQELVITVAINVVVNVSRRSSVQIRENKIDLGTSPTVTIPAVSPDGIVFKEGLGLQRKLMLCREGVRGTDLQVQSELSEQLLTRERPVTPSRRDRTDGGGVFIRRSRVRVIGVPRMGLVAGAKHGQGADDVAEVFVIPEMAVGVTGNESVMHFRCGLSKASHAAEGFSVQLNAK